MKKLLVAPNTNTNTKRTEENQDKMLPGKEERGGIVTGSYCSLAPVVLVASASLLFSSTTSGSEEDSAKNYMNV